MLLSSRSQQKPLKLQLSPQSEREHDFSTPSDINQSLFNREHFIKYIKRGTFLESSTRRLNGSAEATRKATDQLMTFLMDICGEFQKCNDIIELFINGVQQLHQNLHMIMSAFLKLDLPGVSSEDIRTLLKSLTSDNHTGRLSDKLSIMNQTKMALSYTKEANSQCTTVVSEFIRMLDDSAKSKYSEADVLELVQGCKEYEQKFFREVSSLEQLCADSHNTNEQVREFINDHKWKEHELVKMAIAESRSKIRDLKNATERAVKASGHFEDLRKNLNRDIEALVSAKLEQRTEKHESLQKSLKELKMAHRTLKERFSDTQESYHTVETAAKNIKNLDPSGDWPIMRIPARTNQTLCCLLRGPEETLIHLKMSYKKRNHSRFSLLNQSTEKLLSDVIEIDNLAKAATIKWPLIVCIPQKEKLEEDKVRNTWIRWSNDAQAKRWSSEKPLHVNREYIHRRYSLKGVFFTEAKITSFCSLAVVFSESNSAEQSPLGPNTPIDSSRNKQLWERVINYRQQENDLVLSDVFLFDLVSHFQDDWKKILIYLDIPINVIKTHELDHPNSKIEVMLSCLSAWKQSSTLTNNKVEQLKEALKKCKREDLVAMVTDKQSAAKSLSEGQVDVELT